MGACTSLQNLHKDSASACHLALFNSVVLDNIISWVDDVPTLKQLRRVCKFFNNRAVLKLQILTQVRLNFSSNDKYTGKPIDNVGMYNSMNKFVKFIANLKNEGKDIIFRNFQVDGFTFCHKSLVAKRFVLLCAPKMNSMTFRNSFFAEGFLRRFLFVWTPELKHLSFEDCSFGSDDKAYFGKRGLLRYRVLKCNKLLSLHIGMDRVPFSIFEKLSPTTPPKLIFPFRWREIFEFFPNLKTLSLSALSDKKSKNLLRYLRNNCNSSSAELQLRKLNIFQSRKFNHPDIPSGNWELLSHINLPFLTTLAFDIGLIVDEFVFAKSLENFAPTLQTLEMWRGRSASNLQEFPYNIDFPRLKVLELSGNCVNGFKFINCTRNLQSLSILRCDTHPGSDMDFTTIFNHVNTSPGPDKIQPLLTLTNIYIEFSLYKSCVKNLLRLFPNVSSYFVDSELRCSQKSRPRIKCKENLVT